MNYKEKLEEAKRLYKFSNDDQRHVLENLFPELKDDEKIKNQIISFLKEFERDHYRNLDFSSWITWLKRQDEQKLINNVKPKFKVGDTIVEKDFYECGYGIIKDIKDGKYIFTDGSSINIDEQDGWQLSVNVEAKFKVGDWIIGGIYNKPKQILEIRNEGYVTTPPGWISFSFAEDMHLWTLQDAKDGDILVSKYNQPFIYNGNRNFCHVGSYCGLSTSDKFIVSTSKCFWTENVSIRPATKEQCDLLFKRMKEAGYEWDTEKKELKKIELAKSESEEELSDFEATLFSAFSDGWQQYLNGEEVDFAQWAREHSAELLEAANQNHVAWNEEDEKMFSELSSSLLINISDQWVKYGKWLKSLKGRITWKPTEAQLASLTIACDRNDRIGFDLTQLLEDLKKL